MIAQYGQAHAFGVFFPAIAVGLAAVIALNAEMFAQHFHLALNGAHIARYPLLGQLLVQFTGRYFSAARYPA